LDELAKPRGFEGEPVFHVDDATLEGMHVARIREAATLLREAAQIETEQFRRRANQ
jgi:hypothetical protein